VDVDNLGVCGYLNTVCKYLTIRGACRLMCGVPLRGVEFLLVARYRKYSKYHDETIIVVYIERETGLLVL